MDAEVLQAVAGLQSAPKIKQAFITGFEVKIWGIYSALVPATGGGARVHGVVWKAEKEEHVVKLAQYETSAYMPMNVMIYEEDSEISSVFGRTFCWAGDLASPDLTDGSFDLEHYQKYFKQSVLRRG